MSEPVPLIDHMALYDAACHFKHCMLCHDGEYCVAAAKKYDAAMSNAMRLLADAVRITPTEPR